MKICVAMPCNRQVKPKTVLSLLEMVAKSKYDFYFVIATEGYTISENRNYIAFQALKNNCDYIFTVDDDMIFSPDALDILLSRNKDIIGVASHQKTLEIKTTIELLDGTIPMEFPEKVLECKAVGGGIMLIKTNVFLKIKNPWYDTDTFDTGMTKMGEDSWFCKKARENGFKIFCDGTIKVGHIGDFTY